MSEYIHPTFTPGSKEEYLQVIKPIRDIASSLNECNVILIPAWMYHVLEDAVHPSKKGHGHQCYGVQIQIGDVQEPTAT